MCSLWPKSTSDKKGSKIVERRTLQDSSVVSDVFDFAKLQYSNSLKTFAAPLMTQALCNLFARILLLIRSDVGP